MEGSGHGRTLNSLPATYRNALPCLALYLLYCDLEERDGEHVGLDDDTFRNDGGDVTLLAGREFMLLDVGETVLVAAAVTCSFSRLPATSEQKLASDDDEATQSSLLAVDALVRLLLASDSIS